MTSEKNTDWFMYLLAVAAVVLAVLILIKVDKRCKNSKSAKRLRLRVNSNNMHPLSRGAGMKVGANNPIVVNQLAQDYCGKVDPQVVAAYTKIMQTEDACESSIWGNSDDDMVMIYLCNAPIDAELPNGQVQTMKFHDYLQKYNPNGYKTVQNDINCALNPPGGNPVNCCGGNPNPIWN